jgi:hypothetical protein
MNIEPRWNYNDTGNLKELGGKPVTVPFCPPQIPDGLTRVANQDFRCEKPATNHLVHGTAV